MLLKSLANSRINLNKIQILSSSYPNSKHHLSTTSQLNRKPAFNVITGSKPKLVTDTTEAFQCINSNSEIFSQMVN